MKISAKLKIKLPNKKIISVLRKRLGVEDYCLSSEDELLIYSDVEGMFLLDVEDKLSPFLIKENTEKLILLRRLEELLG